VPLLNLGNVGVVSSSGCLYREIFFEVMISIHLLNNEPS